MKNKLLTIGLIFAISLIVIFSFALKRVKSQDAKIEATLYFEHIYEKCNHTESYKSPEILSFNSIDEVETLYSSWKIKTAEEGSIYLIKSSPSYCPNHFKIMLKGNKITVTRLKDESIYEQFYISMKYLTDEDIQKLTSGIILHSQQELTKFTEDFTS